VDSAGPVGPAGADSADGPSIALNPPATVSPSSRIGLTWQASSSLTSFTVFVQRAAGQAFEAVDAVVAGQSAQFERGAAYRLDFPTARVRVRGCMDANQCVDSNEQPLVDALLGGLVQLSAEPFGNRFEGVTLSADGNTLAVNATGVQCGAFFGAIVVYQRAADGQWTPEAALGQSAPGTAMFNALSLALSGDGNTIVAGSYADLDGAGSVQVFTRDAQHNWSRQAFIQDPVPTAVASFGEGVTTTHDGNRIVVTGQAKPPSNRIYVFERDAGQWRQAHIIEQGPGISTYPPATVAISSDGSTFAVPVFSQLNNTFAVHVYKACSCANGWQLVAELRSAKPSFEALEYGFGHALSFSRDGNTLAVGAGGDPGDASDNGTTVNFGSEASGAVYIFAADDGGTWQRRAFLKAKTAPAFDQLGVRVSLSGDGKVLLAGACGFAANANGLRRNHRAGATVGPPGEDNSRCRFGGSGYTFEADGSGAWSHTAAAIAAPGERAEFGDFFTSGSLTFSLSMSADAQTSALLALIMDAMRSPERVVVY
jgi:hypothetical protein